MRKVFRVWIAGSLLCAAVSSPGLAQEDPPVAPDAATSEEPQAAFGDQVVVTAGAVEQKQRHSTASVEVIEQTEIEARGTTEVAQVLTTATGLDLVQAGGPGQQASLFSRGTESDHIRVLWNGVELNDPYFGGFNWAFLTTDGVERIEVVRGPFSALHGSDALGGVVQVLTAAPDGLGLRLEGGADDYRRLGLTAGARLGAVGLEAYGSVRSGDGAFANADFGSDSLAVRADWQAGENLAIGLLARRSDVETGIPFAGGQPDFDRRIAWEDETLALPVRAVWGQWSLDASLARVELSSRYRDPDDPFGFTASATDSRALRGRAVLARHDGDGAGFAVGADWEEARVDDSSVFGVNLDGEERDTRAVFAQWVGVFGRWRVDLGLRQDEDSAYGSHSSPRVGLLFDLGGGHGLHASWGEGFRAPSVGELYFPFSGNPDLVPEVNRGAELGWRYEAGRRHAAVTYFDNDIEDMIDFDLVTFTNVNLGRAATRGLELGVGDGRGIWSWRANATWLEAENVDTGLALLRRPEWRANLVLSAEPGDWDVHLTTRYVGERPDVDAVDTSQRRDNPAYTRFDLAARWDSGRRWAPYARVDNLLDEDYQPALGFPAPGRTWVLGLALNLPARP